MKRIKCHVRECGTTVFILEVAGRSLAVNPYLLELVIEEGAGKGRLVSGYQPHHYTCVDISTRQQLGQSTAF